LLDGLGSTLERPDDTIDPASLGLGLRSGIGAHRLCVPALLCGALAEIAGHGISLAPRIISWRTVPAVVDRAELAGFTAHGAS